MDGHSFILMAGSLPIGPRLPTFSCACLEIGFGNGEFTASYAAAHPDVLLFGMEVSAACIDRCARRLSREGLANVRLIRADARYMLREFFPDASLSRVIMNFPCPWPKKRHARRRVTDAMFADGLAAVLAPGGTFELLTDEAWYAQEAEATLGAHPALAAAPVETVRPASARSKYERKWLEMGKSISRLAVARTDAAFTATRKTWEFYLKGDDATHIHVETPMPKDVEFIAGAFGAKGDAHWSFGERYEGREVFLVEVVTSDEGFEQRYYIRVVPRRGGVMLKIDDLGRVYLTPAVRLSMEDLAERLRKGAEK
ncbi:MAG: tRNA (guanosine(46)-N7)-methyltransferase TrmB [Synergistaceae bacterium]|jgi:tRNA (guanine-N7-)-methyltransferase|nr:tRNA (guanosine(46)-N7)-methyltransferase TrmB [Synergistaceae bacterium]